MEVKQNKKEVRNRVLLIVSTIFTIISLISLIVFLYFVVNIRSLQSSGEAGDAIGSVFLVIISVGSFGFSIIASVTGIVMNIMIMFLTKPKVSKIAITLLVLNCLMIITNGIALYFIGH